MNFPTRNEARRITAISAPTPATFARLAALRFVAREQLGG
jgi:hypothetical protein